MKTTKVFTVSKYYDFFLLVTCYYTFHNVWQKRKWLGKEFGTWNAQNAQHIIICIEKMFLLQMVYDVRYFHFHFNSILFYYLTFKKRFMNTSNVFVLLIFFSDVWRVAVPCMHSSWWKYQLILRMSTLP